MQKIGFGNDLVVFLVICDQALKIAGGSYSWTVDTFTLLNSTKVLICVHTSCFYDLSYSSCLIQRFQSLMKDTALINRFKDT